MELINKNKAKRFGILLIIIGAFIPSILYPLSSLSNEAMLIKAVFAMKGVSYDTSIQDLEIVLAKGELKKDSKNAAGHGEGRLAIPYKYTLAFGILLAFIGIGIVALHKDKRKTC